MIAWYTTENRCSLLGNRPRPNTGAIGQMENKLFLNTERKSTLKGKCSVHKAVAGSRVDDFWNRNGLFGNLQEQQESEMCLIPSWRTYYGEPVRCRLARLHQTGLYEVTSISAVEAEAWMSLFKMFNRGQRWSQETSLWMTSMLIFNEGSTGHGSDRCWGRHFRT